MVTDVLILKTIKYGDNSVIVQAYTRATGLTSLMARGVRKKGAKIRIALLQPMNLAQMVISENKRGQLNYIQEISLAPMYNNIHEDIRKNTIMIFINEILIKTLQEEHPHSKLFDFLKNSLVTLDELQENYSNMHLFFLAGFTKYLGIFPNFEQKGWFDMLEGVAVPSKPFHNYTINKEEFMLFETLFSVPAANQAQIKINDIERKTLLDMLLTYYAIHIPGMERLHSRPILHTILH